MRSYIITSLLTAKWWYLAFLDLDFNGIIIERDAEKGEILKENPIATQAKEVTYPTPEEALIEKVVSLAPKESSQPILEPEEQA